MDYKGILLAKFGCNRINSVNLPSSGNVYRDQVMAILSDIYFEGLSSKMPSHYSFMMKVENILDEIGLEWQTKAGKFTKRLIKAIPELTDYAGILGDRITKRAYFQNGLNWFISLTEEIFWHNGNFGNSNSCWWTTYEESREVFTDAGGIGILWHNDEDDAYNGVGRCWILPIREYDNNHGYYNGLFLFNQYGKAGNLTIRIDDTARLLCLNLPKTDYQNARLYNDDCDTIPYINDNSGIIVKPSSVKVPRGYEYHVDIGGNDRTCYECGDYIHDDDYYTHNGYIYCGSCYDDIFASCDNCGDEYYRDNMTTVNYDIYCRDCLHELFYQCDNCSEWTEREYITEVGYDGYCEECTEELFIPCDNCRELTRRDNAIETEDGLFCEDCKPE